MSNGCSLGFFFLLCSDAFFILFGNSRELWLDDLCDENDVGVVLGRFQVRDMRREKSRAAVDAYLAESSHHFFIRRRYDSTTGNTRVL